MIIDANNLILGRLGTYVAKKALLGEKIDIVNCENTVITGNKKKIFGDYMKKFKRGTPKKGPFFHRTPDGFVKRSIRGMLPYKKDRGRRAYKSIMCYTGIPENLKSEKFGTIKNANVEKLPNLKYVSIGDICTYFGTKLR